MADVLQIRTALDKEFQPSPGRWGGSYHCGVSRFANMKLFKHCLLITSLLLLGTLDVYAGIPSVKWSKTLRAVVSAPQQVQLWKSNEVRIIVAIAGQDGRSVPPNQWPQKIQIWTNVGEFKVYNAATKQYILQQRPLELTLSDAYEFATIVFPHPVYEDVLKVDVTTANADQSEILGHSEVELRRLYAIAFTEMPDIVAADGKTTANVSVRLGDQKGDAVDDMPFLLRGSGPWPSTGNDNRRQIILVPATTNAQGHASFVLPASSQPGMMRFQLIGSSITDALVVTPQVEVLLRNERNRDDEPPEQLWNWREPLIISKNPRDDIPDE